MSVCPMILLIFLPFLVGRTSALCLPDFPLLNQNEDYYQSLFYENPVALQNGATYQGQFPQRPDFFKAYYSTNPNKMQEGIRMPPERLRESTPDFMQGGLANYGVYSGYMTETPGSGWGYNGDQKYTSENNQQEKLSATKEQPSINGLSKWPQQFNAYTQEGSLNCKPSAGLYPNNFYGDDYSSMYNLAAPYIYNQMYLDNLKPILGYNSLKNVDFTETQMNNQDLERMRMTFGNKWDQLKDFYSPRYLTFLESSYQPNFLKNVNVDDQYYKLAMLQNLKKDRTMPSFFRPEYNLNGINQHIFSYLDYLRSIHPRLFPQYQPYRYLQWAAYPGTTGHQQIPMNYQIPPQYFGDRFQNSPKNEMKVTDTVKAESTKVGGENVEGETAHIGGEFSAAGGSAGNLGQEFGQFGGGSGNKYQSASVGGGQQFLEAGHKEGGIISASGTAGTALNIGQEFGQFGEGSGNKYQSASVGGGQQFLDAGHKEGAFSSISGSAGKAGYLGQEFGKLEGGTGNKYQSASIGEAQKFSGAGHKGGGFSSTSGSAGNLAQEFGQFGEGAMNVGYNKNGESRVSKHGVGGDFGGSTITKFLHRRGSKRGHFGSKQKGNFGFIKGSKGDQTIHRHGDNWHTSVLHTFFLPQLTDGKSGDDNDDEDEDDSYGANVVVKNVSSNGGIFSTGGSVKQEGSSELFTTSGGFNQGRGKNGGYEFVAGGSSQNIGGFTPGGGGLDRVYSTGGGDILEGAYTKGGDFNSGVGRVKGMHTSGGGSFGRMFKTGGGMKLRGEKRGRGRKRYSMTTGGGSKREGDFSTGSDLSMLGEEGGERREEAPLLLGSGSKREGVLQAGGGDSGSKFYTGGDLGKRGFSYSLGSLGKSSSFVGEGTAFSGKIAKELSGAGTSPRFDSRFNSGTEESKTAETKSKINADVAIVKKVDEKVVSDIVDKPSGTVIENTKKAEAAKV